MNDLRKVVASLQKILLDDIGNTDHSKLAEAVRGLLLDIETCLKGEEGEG